MGTMPPLNTIIQGDCLEIMRGWPDGCVDLIVTDPPYDDTTHKGGRFQADKTIGKISFKSLEDYSYISELLRISKRWVIVFSPVEKLGVIKLSFPEFYIRGGVWDKIAPSPQLSGDRPAQAVEGIAILHNPGKKRWNGGGKAAIWRELVEHGKKQHETQKPLKLMEKIIGQFSYEKEVICDPFAGSGTTLLAAERLNRGWVGIERMPKYCAIAQARIAAELNQGRLF